MNVNPIQDQNISFGELRLLMTKETLTGLSPNKLERLYRMQRELAYIKDYKVIIDSKGRCAFSMPDGKIYRFRDKDFGKHFTECEKNGGDIFDMRYIYLEKNYDELMFPVCIKEKKLIEQWAKIVHLFKTDTYKGYVEFVKLLARNDNVVRSPGKFSQWKFLIKEKWNSFMASRNSGVVIDKSQIEPSENNVFQTIVDHEGQHALLMPDGKIYQYRNPDNSNPFRECRIIDHHIIDKETNYLNRNYKEFMEPLFMDEVVVSRELSRIEELFKTNPAEGYSEFVKLLNQNYQLANSYQGLTMQRRLIKSLDAVREEPGESRKTQARKEQSEEDWIEHLREISSRSGNK